jgi:hypothetical protein
MDFLDFFKTLGESATKVAGPYGLVAFDSLLFPAVVYIVLRFTKNKIMQISIILFTFIFLLLITYFGLSFGERSSNPPPAGKLNCFAGIEGTLDDAEVDPNNVYRLEIFVNEVSVFDKPVVNLLPKGLKIPQEGYENFLNWTSLKAEKRISLTENETVVIRLEPKWTTDGSWVGIKSIYLTCKDSSGKSYRYSLRVNPKNGTKYAPNNESVGILYINQPLEYRLPLTR